jgi:hypothetical protein
MSGNLVVPRILKTDCIEEEKKKDFIPDKIHTRDASADLYIAAVLVCTKYSFGLR